MSFERVANNIDNYVEYMQSDSFADDLVGVMTKDPQDDQERDELFASADRVLKVLHTEPATGLALATRAAFWRTDIGLRIIHIRKTCVTEAYVTVATACKITGISKSRLYRRMGTGEIECIEEGDRMLISTKDAIELMRV